MKPQYFKLARRGYFSAMLSVLAVAASAGDAFGACSSGSTTITAAQIAGQTNRQMIVQFRVPFASAARVDVFTDAACTQEIPDTLASNAANRAGSVIDGVVSGGTGDGGFVQFPVGTLTGNRSLTQATQYWVQIQNTADSSFVTLTASTAAMPLGNLYPEQPAADATAWDNRGYPKMARGAANRNELYTDPTTGLLVKSFTMPGDAWSQGIGVGDGFSNPPSFDTPIAVSGSWTNLSSAASAANVNGNLPSSGYATCTGNCSVWLPFPKFMPPGGGDWDGGTRSTYGSDNGLDYITAIVWASCSGCSATLTAALTQYPTGPVYHGCSATTSALTSANARYVLAADPDAGFAALCSTAPVRGDLAPAGGTVSASGTAVTLTSGEYFQATWPSGSKILINGVLYTIASVNSATSVTLTTSAGTQSGVSYQSRAMGFLISANAGTGTLSLQAGYKYGSSPQFQVGEDGGQLHCNQNSLSIATDATGVPYSGFTRQGYLCWIQYDPLLRGVYHLAIPKDEAGRPLGETRVVGTTTSQHNFSSNGATISAPVQFQYAGPDANDPTKLFFTVPYNGGTTLLLVSGGWDATLPGCATPYVTWSGAQAYPTFGNNPQESCFNYTNLTNPGNGMDVVSQITSAYSAAHPGFDTTGFALRDVVFLNGLFFACMSASPSRTFVNFSDPGLEICGTFGSSGSLTQVFDTFSTYPARWGAVHGPPHMNGTWVSVTLDWPGAANPGVPLAGPFQFPPARINLAAFGLTPNWTSNTALDNGTVNQYACPTSAQMQSQGTAAGMADQLVTLGSTGAHCVQIETTSEPCSVTPYAGSIFSGGTKTEAQQWPCSTNANYSQLQTIQPGDAFKDGANGPYGETFIVLTKQIVSPSGACVSGSGNCTIDMWVMRGGGVWPGGLVRPYPDIQAHANSWGAYMAVAGQVGAAPIWASLTTAPAWNRGYFGLALSHGASAQGISAQYLDSAFVDVNNGTTFDTSYNLDVAQAAMPPWGTGCETCSSPAFPVFGGNAISMINAGLVQLYGDASDLANAGQRTALFERHLNPALGTGGETASGMGSAGYTLTPVTGTMQTYTISDPYSAGAPNQKLTPLAGWAGAHLLADYSGIGSVLPDAGYGMCRALNAGECVSGSSAGTTYVSLPSAAGFTQGIMGQHTQNAPAVVNAASSIGQMEQVIFHKPDADGSHQRILGQLLTGLGRQWQFNGPKLLPTGDWYLGTMVYRDGFTTRVGLFQMPRYLEDSVNRTGYVSVPIAAGGASGDSVRVEFWYQEWSGVNERAEHAFTSSNPTASSPLLWASETQAYTPCGSGCTINVPSIAGRLLYYSVHRKSGTTETAGPVQIRAVQ